MGWRDWFRPKEPPPPFTDPQLGVLTWRVEEGGWTGIKDGLSFTFGNERDNAPRADLRMWAFQVLSDPAYLERSLREAIADAPKYLSRFDEEMKSLEYSHLYFSENAKGKYIFATLEPGREYRCWRLEFDGEKCLGIGFDT